MALCRAIFSTTVVETTDWGCTLFVPQDLRHPKLYAGWCMSGDSSCVTHPVLGERDREIPTGEREMERLRLYPLRSAGPEQVRGRHLGALVRAISSTTVVETIEVVPSSLCRT